jgi:hypothetical protein
MRVVLEFLAECIRQTSEATIVYPHRQIGAPRLLANFPGATGKSSNLRKGLSVAKFVSNYNTLMSLERE